MKKLLLVSVLFTSLLAVSCSQPSNGISRSQDNWLADSVPSIKQPTASLLITLGLLLNTGTSVFSPLVTNTQVLIHTTNPGALLQNYITLKSSREFQSTQTQSL